MRALVLAAVATAVSLAAPAANATVVTFSPLASINSHYLPGGPYQENGLQFLSLGSPLMNGTVPYVPSGSTNATLLFDYGPLVITAAGGDPSGGSTPFRLISLDVDNYASTFGVGIRFEYFDATGYHVTTPQALDNLPGLETITLNLTDVRWVRLFPTYGPPYGFQIDNVNYTLPAAPEPATWALLLLGFAGVSFVAYRRKSNMTLRIA